MVFQIPEKIAPENYPLAWLLGQWKGTGVLEYEGIDAAGYIHELNFDNDDDGPYLAFSSRIWLINEPAGIIDKEEPGFRMYPRVTKGELWSALSGFVRVAPTAVQDGKMTICEATSSTPTGHAATWAGVIRGPQFQFQADAIASAAGAPDFQSARIMGGLVESDLFLSYDMAAFGHPMRSYMAGRLSRLSDFIADEQVQQYASEHSTQMVENEEKE